MMIVYGFLTQYWIALAAQPSRVLQCVFIIGFIDIHNVAKSEAESVGIYNQIFAFTGLHLRYSSKQTRLRVMANLFHFITAN